MSFVARQERLEQVRREAQREAQGREAHGEMKGGDGRLTMRIPRAAYLNAVGGHGVDPGDEEYWQDMARLYPETVVRHTPRQMRMGFAGTGQPAARLTRFGRVTMHKRYG
jgi:hypothetical protein